MNVEQDQSNGEGNVVNMRQTPFTVRAHSEADTVLFCQRLAKHLRASDVVLFDGSLAAGKTFIVRSVVESLQTDDQVSSPTYTIANLYQTARCDVLHVDAYRLSGEQEFFELGLDYQIESSVCLVEWGNRISGAFESYLCVEIVFVNGKDQMRDFRISSRGARWAAVMKDLRQGFECR